MSLSAPFSAEDQRMIESWLTHARSGPGASLLERLARYAPDLGWRAVLAVLRRPESERHVGALARPVRWLVVQADAAFIDRIEAEAARDPRFRACLGHLSSDPGVPIPEHHWGPLSRAAGVPIGPISPGIKSLWEEMPDLGELLLADFRPLDRNAPPVLSAEELDAAAADWLTTEETFWAWEEMRRTVNEDPPERAWAIVRELIQQSPDEDALGAIGAGPLEDLLVNHGEQLIADLEAAARADQRVRYAVSSVWQSDMSDAVWQRVVAARGDEPQRG